MYMSRVRWRQPSVPLRNGAVGCTGVKVLLAGEQQAAVTVAVEGLMDGKPLPDLESFLTFDPKVGRLLACHSMLHAQSCGLFRLNVLSLGRAQLSPCCTFFSNGG